MSVDMFGKRCFHPAWSHLFTGKVIFAFGLNEGASSGFVFFTAIWGELFAMRCDSV
jgi:hypothetical protein